MQIKIEVDVRPEELRRFLGLPDVSGLQEDVIAFLRDKIGVASEFDASQFVRNNFDVLKRAPGFKTILSRLHVQELHPDDLDLDPPARRSPRKKRASTKKRAARPSRRKSESASDAADQPPES